MTTPCGCHICVLQNKQSELQSGLRDRLVKKFVGYKLSGNSEVFSLGVDDARRIVDYLMESIQKND